MKVINARNVHQALPEALYQLEQVGIDRDSRNGPVRRFPEPVATRYERPLERVMFWPERNANPFFHLHEALWMLAGRNDVQSVAKFVGRMRTFSDDGVTFHGAYGYRWRHWFDKDQLTLIIEGLKADKTDRRQVLSMWDGRVDLGRSGKDLPCNLQAIFEVDHEDKLNMTVTNRSNDIIWGAYGANAVHFSYLQEYVASCIGVAVGKYWQVSANFHAYVDVLAGVDVLKNQLPFMRHAGPDADAIHWANRDPYVAGFALPYPLMTKDKQTWDAELEMYMDEPDAMGFTDPFFRRVAIPMRQAHAAFKGSGDPHRFFKARTILQSVAATDWRLAAIEWINRREIEAAEKARRAMDDGVSYE